MTPEHMEPIILVKYRSRDVDSRMNFLKVFRHVLEDYDHSLMHGMHILQGLTR